MSDGCIGNCIICGKCKGFPILDEFTADVRRNEPREGFGIAVDIGTTTVALALMDLTDGKITARHSFMNPQRVFGPDVISRIDAANKGHLNELRRMIARDVAFGAKELLASQNVPPESVADMAVAGNTTMIYLLLGFPCESLGAHPFKPAFKHADVYSAPEVFGGSGVSCNVRVFPWLAAFVGGDITAGLLYAAQRGKQRFLLIDLGTNGEIALFDKGKLTVASTAAGPAFETHGRAGGASGAIGELARMVRGGVVDETGLLKEGKAAFTQKQVRALQLAKSAVRSGLEILANSGGAKYADLEAVYLAGGIGQAMDVNDAVAIGLIPAALRHITRAVGNSSLGGAALALSAPARAEKEIKRIRDAVTEINLVAHPDFNGLFVEHMIF